MAKRKTILSVVGARPQFVKAAALSKMLRQHFREILVHTGQHYDYAMSESFFEGLNIPKPDHNIGAGSGSHAAQTAKIMVGLESITNKEKPDAILVYGDTNSTVAGALVGAKLNIPVIHVESGARSFDKTMPEEINRVVCDHLSSLLFCVTHEAVENLKKEGVVKNVYNVGNLMEEVLSNSIKSAKNKQSSIREKYGIDGSYVFCTLHRAANTDNKKTLTNIITGLIDIKKPIVWPLHPRTKKMLEDYKLLSRLKKSDDIKLLPPVAYIESVALQVGADKIITDSGGVQREAYFLQKPCLTLRDTTEWPETVKLGWNKLVDPTSINIKQLLKQRPAGRGPKPKNPHASEKIVKRINSYLN